jgi:hypothetical protein
MGLLAALPCAAQELADAAAQAVADAGQPRIEVELSKEPSVGAPQLAEVLQSGRAALAADEALRSRWWVNAGRVTLGAGADWPRGPQWSEPQLVFGVRTNVSAQARLGYEWRASSGLTDEAQGGRYVLEFRTPPSEMRALRDGLLRFQLSGSSSVHLRPRRSGLLVTYRAQF